jgi:hypothetical protein
MLRLSHGLAFADLYTTEGVEAVDRLIVAHHAQADAPLAGQIAEARRAPEAHGAKAEGDLMIDVAPHVEDFVASLFGIENEVRALEAAHHALAPLYAVKRQFVQRKAMTAFKADAAATFDGPALRTQLEARIGAPIVGRRHESAFANAVTAWLEDETANAEALDLAMRYAAWASHTPAGRAAHRDGVLFRAPRKLDPMKLVPIVPVKHAGVTAFTLEAQHHRERSGFALTDPGTDLIGGLDQAHYCIGCHEQGKDSCARGLFEKKPAGPMPTTSTRLPVGARGVGRRKSSGFQRVSSE